MPYRFRSFDLGRLNAEQAGPHDRFDVFVGQTGRDTIDADEQACTGGLIQIVDGLADRLAFLANQPSPRKTRALGKGSTSPSLFSDALWAGFRAHGDTPITV